MAGQCSSPLARLNKTMNAIWDSHIIGFRERLAQDSVSASFAGVTFSCILNRITQGNTITEGGEWLDYDATITCLTSDLTTAPKEGMPVIVGTERYKIGPVKYSANMPTITIPLKSTKAP